MKYFILFTLIFQRCKCALTSGPIDTVSIIGSTVLLMCSSDKSIDNAKVTWSYIKSYVNEELCDIMQGNWIEVVAPMGVIPIRFQNKFSLEIEPNGFQNLRIHNVSYDEAGCYACIDNNGFDTSIRNGQYKIAQLTIINNVLSCTHNMDPTNGLIVGSNICNIDKTIQEDIFAITCKLDYRGYKHPNFIWYSNPEVNDILKVNTSLQNNINSYIVTKFTAPSSSLIKIINIGCDVEKLLQWISPQLKFYSPLKTNNSIYAENVELYSNETIDRMCYTELVKHLLCKYSWIKNDQKYERGQTLILTGISGVEGEYTCIVECNLRGNLCQRLIVQKLNITGITMRIFHTTNTRIIIISIIITVIVIILTAVLIIIYNKKEIQYLCYQRGTINNGPEEIPLKT